MEYNRRKKSSKPVLSNKKSTSSNIEYTPSKRKISNKNTTSNFNPKFHISTIQYAPSSNKSSEDIDDISSGDEEGYSFHPGKRTNKERPNKKIKLEKAKDKDIKKTPISDLFPYKKIPYSSYLSDDEDSSDDEYKKSKQKIFKQIKNNYIDLGGDKNEFFSGTVIENRPFSLFDRHNKFEEPRVKYKKFRKKSRVWHRKYQDINTEKELTDIQVKKRAKSLRRRLSKGNLKRKFSEFNEKMKSLDKVEDEIDSVPYSQLRDYGIKNARKHHDFPEIGKNKELIFTTIDSDIKQLNSEQPIKEGREIFEKNKKKRMVAVPYIYNYDFKNEFPEEKYEKKRKELQLTTFMISANDGSNRRIQSNMEAKNIYTPEPLNMTRIINLDELNKISFVEKSITKRKNDKDKPSNEHLVNESKHLRKSINVKDNEIQFTESSYLTEPQKSFKKEIISKSKKYSGEKLMNKLFQDHPQTHSRTNRIAQSFTDKVDTKPFTNPVKSLISDRINEFYTLDKKGELIVPKKQKSLEELSNKNRLIKSSLKGEYKTNHSKRKKPKKNPILTKKTLNIITNNLEPKIVNYSSQLKQATKTNEKRYKEFTESGKNK